MHNHLFPYFVCRVAGVPESNTSELRAVLTGSLLERLFELELRLDGCKKHLVDLLHGLIGKTSERETRGKLLELRRQLHAQRPIPSSLLNAAQKFFPDQKAAGLLSEYVQMRELHERYVKEAESSYKNEIVSVRDVFQGHLQHPDFQKGLLISSRTLYSAMSRYLSRKPAEIMDRSDEEKIERGLLRYFTRTAMKATPFSTFCTVISGSFTPLSNGHASDRCTLGFRGELATKKSTVRLNKSLYGILLSHLKTRPTVRKHLHVELNPTVYLEDNRFVFLASVGGQEVFQRLSRNPALDLISDVFKSHADLPLRMIIETLQAHPEIDASEEEVSQYLDKLIEFGLLRFRTGIHEQEVDWDIPFEELLLKIDDDHARRILTLLNELRTKTDAYGTANVKNREMILDEMKTLVASAFEALEIKAQMTMGIPFYEDASADAVANIPQDDFLPLSERLSEYAKLTLPLAWPRAELASMRHFFEKNYPDGNPVPILQFYEKYYRNHYKAHLEKQHKIQAGQQDQELSGYNIVNPFNLESIRRCDEARKRLTELITKRWREQMQAKEIQLSKRDFENCLQGVELSAPFCGSLSFFCQLVSPAEENETPKLIVPNGLYFSGFGKYFSRFLCLFDERVQQELYSANQAMTDEYLAEICGDANFNGNLHPALLHWEISYPTGESGNASGQIRSSDLFVELDDDDPNALCLRHGLTDKRVTPIDLGFLNPKMRPPLYQLLTSFMPPSNFFLPIPETPTAPRPRPAPQATSEANDQTPANQDAELLQIHRRPRVTYAGSLVLTRECWFVPFDQFPASLPKESSFEYFIRVNRWRRDHGIPQEVYVRVRPLPPNRPSVNEKPEPKDSVAPAPAEPVAEKQDENPVDSSKAEASKIEENGKQADGESAAGKENARKKFTNMSRDFHKPQYIDFHNPLLVRLFGKMTVLLKNGLITLEERFPAQDQPPQFQEKAYVTELILQLDFPDEKAAVKAIQQEEASYVAA